MDVKSKRSRIYLLAVIAGILLVLGIFLVIGVNLGDGSEYDTDDPDGTTGSMPAVAPAHLN